MATIAFERKNNNVRFLGEMNFDDLVSKYSNSLFERDGILYDEVGEVVSEQTEGEYGILDFDGIHNQVFAIDSDDLEVYFGTIGAQGWAEEILKGYCSIELKESLSEYIYEDDEDPDYDY